MKAIKDGLSFIFDQINWVTATMSAKITPFLVLLWVLLQDFFSPTIPTLFYVMILGGADVITGVWASHREGKQIVSEHFWRRKASVVVLFLIGVICMLAFDRMLKETHEAIPAFALPSWFFFYSAYEVISVLENLARIGLLPGIKGFTSLFKKKITDDIAQAIAEDKKEEEKKP